MSEIEPNGLPKNLGQRLPDGMRKHNRQLKARGETPVVDARSQSISQARELYSSITRQLADSSKLTPLENAVLEVRQVWLRHLIPSEDAFTPEEKSTELRRIMEPPEVKSYLTEIVGKDALGKPVTRSAMLRDEIQILLRTVTHRGHK